MSFLLFGTNLLESAATITVTSALSGSPATRLYDRQRGLQWGATTAALQQIQSVQPVGVPKPATAFAVVNHNISSVVEIFSSTDGVGATLRGSAVPTTDPFIFVFGGTTSERWWTVNISANPVSAVVGEFFLGVPKSLVLPPFVRSEGRATMGNVRRDTSPAGYTWSTQRGVKRSRFAYAWNGLDAVDLATIEAAYDEIDQGAKPLFLLDETGTAFWMNCVTPTLAPVPVGAGLYELPELAFEEALT